MKISYKFDVTDEETNFSQNIKIQLDEYFWGKRKIFDININPQGTNFQKQVWNELLKIPYGTTKSYSEIAENIDNKKAQKVMDMH